MEVMRSKVPFGLQVKSEASIGAKCFEPCGMNIPTKPPSAIGEKQTPWLPKEFVGTPYQRRIWQLEVTNVTE